jgi:hypothetical protein
MPLEPEKYLILTFENDGKTVHKETTGFVGKDCEDVTAFIENALSANVTEHTRKREYYDEKDKRVPRLNA